MGGADETQAGILLDGRYRLEREIGRGGAASVWRAEDLSSQERVAVKLLHPHLRLVDGPRRRFAHEAEVLADLAHPSIVRAKGHNLESARPYIAMEYMEGVRLDQELRRRREDGLHFDGQTIAQVLESLADALEHAHQKGVIHRDLKPSNIILTQDGSPCILDFGVARLLGESDQTTLGRMVGTYRYMSPEQARGERIDPRSDVYSLGLITYQLLTLERPWGGDVPVKEILQKISGLDRPKPTLARPDIDPAFDEVIRRVTAVDRNDRPPSALAFWREVEPLLPSLPTPRRPTIPERPPTNIREKTRSLESALAEDTHSLEPPTEDTHSIDPATKTVRKPSATARPRSRLVEGAPVALAVVSLLVILLLLRDPSETPSPTAIALEEPRSLVFASTVAVRVEAEPAAPPPPVPAPAPKRKPPPKIAVRPPPLADPHAGVRWSITLAEADPKDGELFDRAADRVRETVLSAKVPGRQGRWLRMLEIARLNRDHAALSKIVGEIEGAK